MLYTLTLQANRLESADFAALRYHVTGAGPRRAWMLAARLQLRIPVLRNPAYLLAHPQERTITRIKMVVFDILNSVQTEKRLAVSRQAPRF